MSLELLVMLMFFSYCTVFVTIGAIGLTVFAISRAWQLGKGLIAEQAES